ncbi:hypothetical protein ACFLT3_01645 [Chloroflexota bacterium]
MSDSKKKILEMLSENKISADEAYRLLNAVESGDNEQQSTSKTYKSKKGKAKYLRVTVLPDPDKEHAGNVDRVNVRIPMSLIRAGIKLTSLIPNEARDKVNRALLEKGISFDTRNFKPDDIEELIEALSEFEVDVMSSKGEKVRVFVEY